MASSILQEKKKNDFTSKPITCTPRLLQTANFPTEFKNKYSALPTYGKQNVFQEKVFDGESDKRSVRDTNEVSYYSRIGQLRSIFEQIKGCGSGTATVFYTNSNSGRAYAITCAHNLIHYNHKYEQLHLLKNAWFDRRITSNYKIYYSSKSIKKYEIDAIWIHPQYNPKQNVCPYDLGIVSFIDDDKYFNDHGAELSVLNTNTRPSAIDIKIAVYRTLATASTATLATAAAAIFVTATAAATVTAVAGGTADAADAAADIVAAVTVTAAVAVVGTFDAAVVGTVVVGTVPITHVVLFGYPGAKKKNGQLWGESMVVSRDYNEIFKKFKQNKMISYKIHTSGGQSGSSITHMRCRRYPKIIGIHTGGNSTSENWGVVLNGINIEWILNCVQSISPNANRRNIMRLFYDIIK